MQTPAFKKRLAREIKLFIRETKDGCLDCRELRTTCHEHTKLFLELAINPRKFITITSTETKDDSGSSANS